MITTEKVQNSLKWSSYLMAFEFISKILIKLILAYLLVPEDFGLVALCALVINLAQVFSDLGFASVLIQKRIENNSRILSSVFWFNLFFNVLLYLIIFFLASSLLSDFYKNPLLDILLKVISLQIVISPFFFVNKLILNRDLKFKELFYVNAISILISSFTAVVLAFYGFGVWAIIFQSIIAALTQLILYIFLGKWTVSFIYKFIDIKNILTLGVFDFLKRVVEYVTQNSQTIILSAFLTIESLGFLAFATTYTISIWIPFRNKLKKLFFPLFSKIQDDKERIKSNHLTTIEYTVLLFIPYVLFLFFFSDDILFLFSEGKWYESAIVFQFFSVLILIQCTEGTPDVIMKSFGKFDDLFYLQIIRCVLLIASMLYGIIYFEIEGLLYAMIIIQVILNYISYLFIKPLINLTLAEIINQIKSSVVYFLILFCLFFFIKLLNLPRQINIVISILLMSITYINIFLKLKKEKNKLILKDL
jgi:teichuronic acid exporter